jgi:hypothetical protein
MALNDKSGPLIVWELSDVPTMQNTFLIGVLACLFCVCALPGPASAPHFEAHTVPLAVVTADGNPVTDLQSPNVRVSARNDQVTSLNLDTGPRRIVLLLDTSGSMGIPNRKVTLLQAALHTAGLFLNRVPSFDLFSVYAFAEKQKKLVPITHDMGAIYAAISAFSSSDIEEHKKEYGARTDLMKAFTSVLAVLSDSPQFGDAMIIFSDGLFPRSDEGDILTYYDQPDNLQRLTPRVGTLGVRVFFSLAGNVEGTPPRHGVELFVGSTGGKSFELHDSGDVFYGLDNPYGRPGAPMYRSGSLEQRALALSAAIQETYRVQLQFTKPLRRTARLHFDLMQEGGKSLHDVVVLSPAFVYPGSATQR